ncbi:MAG: HD domain-containing protein [Blastocatellia bacterium]|nr:HD domain-containing protein [Blastocatellia bacterium]
MNITDEIVSLYERRAHGAYFGEAVSELEHALQSAALAAGEGASERLIVASLLHDIGHLLHRYPENIADLGVDARHEIIGAAWLGQHFDEAVTEPVRLHVDAKRYLCATEPAYLAGLSPASRKSLQLQGGPMSLEEAAAFHRTPWTADSVRLRRWDDQAKVPGLVVPELDSWRPLLDATLR